MGDYLRIARAYLCGTTATVWCFLFLCLLFYSAIGEELARNQGAIIGGVFSRKSYLAMFAYFNACLLGVLLRDNIAQPWASVLPHYRRKHLLVIAFIALFFLAIPMYLMEFFGTRDIAPTSVAVIFLICLAGGLWTLHHPILGVLAFPFLVFVMAPASSSPGFAAFLAGTSTATSVVLVFLSLLALWALAWRLLVLDEDKFEYAIARIWGDLFRGRGGQTLRGLFNAKAIEDYLASLPADKRVAFQNRDPMNGPFTNLKQIDNLSGYSERSLWHRLKLWRLGTSPMGASASLGGQILFLLIFILATAFIPLWVGVENPIRENVLIMSVMIMTNPFNTWFFWYMRLHRLGYESVRPRTRMEFVRELGLALLWDIIQCWLGGVLFMGIAAAIWAPELLQSKNILLFISGTGVGQLCVYAMMGNWLLKQRGMVASVSYAFCPFLGMVSWVMFLMNDRIGVEVIIVIGSVLVVASVPIIALAYRRWCMADLD